MLRPSLRWVPLGGFLEHAVGLHAEELGAGEDWR
jgi:hypothetical protein